MKKVLIFARAALPMSLGFVTLIPFALRTASAQLKLSSPTTAVERESALNTLFGDYWQDRLKHSPELASNLGDKRYDDQLSDYSVAAYDAQLARGRSLIEKLAAIDPAGLPDQVQLSRELLLRQLIDDQEESKFRTWELPVDQQNGFQVAFPTLIGQLSFDTVGDYDHYIARLNKVPTVFQQITENMNAGIDDHRTISQYIVGKVIVETKDIAKLKPEESPFAGPLKKFPAAVGAEDQKRIHDELLDVIARQVLPAYTRFGKYLDAVYLPHARTDLGVWAVPDGDAYYAFLIRQNTTTKLTAAEIHQIGLDEVKRDETEMLAIAQKLGFSSIASLRATIQSDPKLHPASSAQLKDAYQGYIDGMKPKLPQLFGRLPKAGLIVDFMPDFLAPTAPLAYYMQGTPDGKRPGEVAVNGSSFATRSLTGVEVVAYHEGIPGHHLQIAIGQELTDLPEFRRENGYTAYTEGWALYSERLGKEVGLYQDPYNDFGRLEADMWRAIRLVVDTGVHSKHWSRQQMIDYFHAHSGLDEANIQSETDRYIAWPGQALGYKIGQLKILELRSRAQQALGPKFDIRAFHDQVIDSGALPMDVLESRIDTWIATQKAGK
jgi:uncharacterized protein (DUF885 family)